MERVDPLEFLGVDLTPDLPNDRTPRPGDVVNQCSLSPDIFPRSCNSHDVCYQTAGVSRAQCDSEFLENMLAERPDIQDLVNTPPPINGGNLVLPLIDPAILYFYAVRLFGGFFHSEDNNR